MFLCEIHKSTILLYLLFLFYTSKKIRRLSFYLSSDTLCKKQVFDQQFSEKLDSADFGKLVLHIVIDKAVMRQRAAASLLGA